MKRLHLFEFEDQRWYPRFLRQGTTDFLAHVFSNANLYAPIIPLIGEVLEREDMPQIVDLCSGSGGGILKVKKGLEQFLDKKVKLTLTDKYPNKLVFDSLKNTCAELDVVYTSIDANEVPDYLRGTRTIFTAFHHFRPHKAEAILRDAVDKGVPIGVFEPSNKGLLATIKMIIFVPIRFWVVTPSLRPFKLSRIVFTYLLPLIPLCTVWDGIVSMERVYTPYELEKMANKCGGKNYTWKTGIARHKEGVGKNGGGVIYLIGCPGNH